MNADEPSVGWQPPRPSAPPAGGPAPPPPVPTTSGDDPTFGDRVRGVLGAVGADRVDVPFETFGEAVRWWFRPIADVTTWRSLGAAIVMSIVGPLLFGLTIAVIAVVFGLSFVLVGLLLIVPAFAVLRSFTVVGRRLAGWAIDEPIGQRPPARADGGLFSPITTRLTDETRWRHVGFLLLDGFVAPFVLVASVLPIVLVTGSFGSVEAEIVDGPTVDVSNVFFAPSLGQLLLVVPLLGLVARLVQVVARLRHRYVAALLCPGRESQLVERVEELSVQRDQVLDAVAAERRRIERNLHDGVQQQLVALGIDIGRASNKLDDDPEAARQLLDDARDKVRSSIGELRLIGRGLHPAVLEDRGLDAALSSVVASAPIPISVDVSLPVDEAGLPVELPTEVSETAYYVANEAITNVLKYAGARVASIRVAPEPGLLPAVRVVVHDDGRGGADASRGSGIAGMRARVEAVDGAFHIDSPSGGPTAVTAVIPIRRPRPRATDLEFTPADASRSDGDV